MTKQQTVGTIKIRSRKALENAVNAAITTNDNDTLRKLIALRASFPWPKSMRMTAANLRHATRSAPVDRISNHTKMFNN